MGLLDESVLYKQLSCKQLHLKMNILKQSFIANENNNTLPIAKIHFRKALMDSLFFFTNFLITLTGKIIALKYFEKT